MKVTNKPPAMLVCPYLNNRLINKFQKNARKQGIPTPVGLVKVPLIQKLPVITTSKIGRLALWEKLFVFYCSLRKLKEK
jgi:hypothetical protein